MPYASTPQDSPVDEATKQEELKAWKSQGKIPIKFRIYNKTKKLAGISSTLLLKQDEKIKVIKHRIRDKHTVPIDAQYLIFGLDHLEDEKTLQDYGIEANNTIYCTPTTCEDPRIPNL